MEKGIFFYNICASEQKWEHDYDTVFPLLKEHGIDGFQFSDNEIIAEGEDRLLAEMKKHGMKTYVIHSVLKSITEDAEEMNAARWRAAELFELAKKFDCKRVMPVPFYGADKTVLNDRAASLELAAEMFAYCQSLGKKYGIEVYIENFGTAIIPYTSSAEVISIMGKVDGLKYCLDTGNYLYAGYDVHKEYECFRKKTELVHIKNGYTESVDGKAVSVDRPLDVGERDFLRLFAKLKADGVVAPFIMEYTATTRFADIFRDSEIIDRCFG